MGTVAQQVSWNLFFFFWFAISSQLAQGNCVNVANQRHSRYLLYVRCLKTWTYQYILCFWFKSSSHLGVTFYGNAYDRIQTSILNSHISHLANAWLSFIQLIIARHSFISCQWNMQQSPAITWFVILLNKSSAFCNLTGSNPAALIESSSGLQRIKRYIQLHRMSYKEIILYC